MRDDDLCFLLTTTTGSVVGDDMLWLDCDPGHDDAVALLLALFAPRPSPESSLSVLGVSTVHGNSVGSSTYLNAVRLLSAFKVDPSQCRIWRGADVPLMRPARVDVGIHGEDGLGGVEGLPDLTDELVQRHLRSTTSCPDEGAATVEATLPTASPLKLVTHLLGMLQRRLEQNLPPISIVATGPLTNIALLIRMCPGGSELDLLQKTVDKIVIMGGSAGAPGNRTPLAGG